MTSIKNVSAYMCQWIFREETYADYIRVSLCKHKYV